MVFKMWYWGLIAWNSKECADVDDNYILTEIKEFLMEKGQYVQKKIKRKERKCKTKSTNDKRFYPDSKRKRN